MSELEARGATSGSASDRRAVSGVSREQGVERTTTREPGGASGASAAE